MKGYGGSQRQLWGTVGRRHPNAAPASSTSLTRALPAPFLAFLHLTVPGGSGIGSGVTFG